MRWTVLPLLLLAALLQGCTLSKAQILRADATVAASVDRSLDCQHPDDHCAAPSPLLEAADQALARSTPQQPQHTVTLLDDSEAALAARINLIRAARRSIDVQTYIWDQDDAGRLVLDELVQAARRGVQVRILADQLFSFNDPILLDRLARAHQNLQIRLYNPTFHKARTPPLEFAAGVVCCFLRFNQRMHNKILLVDGSIGITGGRNYQDRYFNWDQDFDYVDRDVMVGGPAAKAMAASFELFWGHRRSVPLTHLRDVNRQILADAAPPKPWRTPDYAHPQRVARVQQEAEDPDWLQEHLVEPSLRTGRVDFFSDLPAKTEQPQRRNAREFTRHLMRLIGGAHREVVLQTPYLVMTHRARRLFKRLRRQEPPPRIVVSTNSLAATDAFAVYALSFKHRKQYLEDYGFEMYEMKPRALAAIEDNAEASSEDEPPPPERQRPARRIPGTEARGYFGSRGSGSGRGNRPAPLLSQGRRFGLHAKSVVVDDSLAMVGSHNFDPRSDHYNTEAGVIVYDSRFAERLRGSILRLTEPQNAWIIARRPPTIPILGNLSEAIGDLSASLPVFDFWPFRYATSYELKSGCAPMRPSDPAFYSCYAPVGDFPEVALSSKAIYTRLIAAFFGSVKGVL